MQRWRPNNLMPTKNRLPDLNGEVNNDNCVRDRVLDHSVDDRVAERSEYRWPSVTKSQATPRPRDPSQCPESEVEPRQKAWAGEPQRITKRRCQRGKFRRNH